MRYGFYLLVFCFFSLMGSTRVLAQYEKYQPVRVNELLPSSQRLYKSLDGIWHFDLDSLDVGEEDGWYMGKHVFTDSIRVPGCLAAQGKGLSYLPLTEPRWAGTSDKPYLGISWYYKSFFVPESFQGKTIHLNFGGVMTDCKVWLNGRELGTHHYASVPFGFDVGDLVMPGEQNTLAVRVENNQHYEWRTPSNTHGLGITTMEMRWSGIFRSVELQGLNKTWIANVNWHADAKNSFFTATYKLMGEEAPQHKTFVSVKPAFEDADVQFSKEQKHTTDNKGTLRLAIDDPHLWSDEDPYLYCLTLGIVVEGDTLDAITERVGLRDFDFDGKHFLINGQPVYLRGEMVHYHWPKTISPTTNRNDLRKKLQVYKDYGFNFYRHHTHFPSPEYMEVCDELGILCHNELNVVSGSMVIEKEHREPLWELLLRRNQNHASFMFYCMGNERLPSTEEIQKFRRIARTIDSSRFFMTNSPGDIYLPDGRKFRAPIHHEFRRAGASYIDLQAKPLYESPIRPWRMLYAEDRTAKAGLDQYLPLFLQNTLMLQSRSRKILLERVRLDDVTMSDQYNFAGLEYQGYQLCKFRDGGSFAWGVVNDFFEPKHESPEQTKKYNNSSVLLWPVEWQDRIFNDRKGEVPLLIRASVYERNLVPEAVLSWYVMHADTVFLCGKEHDVALRNGMNQLLLSDAFPIPGHITGKMTLYAELKGPSLQIKNDWDFWVFPRVVSRDTLVKMAVPVITDDLPFSSRLQSRFDGISERNGDVPSNALLLTEHIDEVLLNHLEKGGRAMLFGKNHFDGLVTEWGAGRSEYNRGTIIFDHPLTRTFPHEGWCDMPFAYLINGSDAQLHGNRNELGVVYDLSDWPVEIQPIIMGIPSYKTEKPQRLAHLFEVKVGRGRLLVSSFSFDQVHPFADFLLNKMLYYAAGKSFSPDKQVSVPFLRSFERGGEIQVENVGWEDSMMPFLKRPYDNKPFE